MENAHPAAGASHPPFVSIGEGLYAVPSLHGRPRFAALVRAAVLTLRPAAMALELPATLESSIRAGVERLPFLSVVGYDDFDSELEKVRQILPITPDDSLVEAYRLGLRLGIPVHCIDRDVLNYQGAPISAPDDFLLERIGLEAYWHATEHTMTREPAPDATPEPGRAGRDEDALVDAAREEEMAAHLLRLRAEHPGQPVLLVCGMAHLRGIMAHLKGTPGIPPGGVTQREHTLYSLARESTANVINGLAWEVYAHEMARAGLRPANFPALVPPPNTRGGELDSALEAYSEAMESALTALRAAEPRDASPEGYALLAELVQGAVALYRREWNEQPSPARLQILMRFARNLALTAHRLTPGRYSLVLAAKNTVNDDFAYQTLRLADHYPFHEEDSDLPEMKIEGDMTGEAEGEPLVLRLRMPRAMLAEAEEALEELDLEDPPDEYEEGAWQQRWEDGERHVSHLPQDTRLENFFTYLREKARRLLSDQQVRLHEMQTSLMDGLDLRETLRNLPLGKMYVRENLPGVGDVGPVVVIFHKPGEEDEYPHEKMWYAEHDGESDLALYATEPGVKLDGPGISRCQYGGVLSLYPPTGRAWVWDNPRYDTTGRHSRAEVLLRAAIDLSRKPIVAYVASQGPSADMLALAASRGVHILYIPLDTLSADMLKRVRTFHVLADRLVRTLAHMYVN